MSQDCFHFLTEATRAARRAMGARQRQIAFTWRPTQLAFLAIALFLFAGFPTLASAANGTWIDTTTGGLWSNPANWSGGTIADGQDAVADFGTLNITADNVVHLDSFRTVGTLKFGDTTPSNNWLLDNNGNSANTLNLMTSSGSPTIQVNNRTTTISANLVGTEGLTVVGSGTLTLSGSNSFDGGTVVAAGSTVMLNGSTTSAGGTITSGPAGIGPVTLGSSGTASASLLLPISPGLVIGNSVVASDLDTGTLTLGGKNTTGVTTFSGDITLGQSANVGKRIALTAAAGGEVDFTGSFLANGTDITGGISLTGPGTVRLSGNSTYGGGTGIAGIAILDPTSPSNQVLGQGVVGLGSGSLLELKSSNAIANNPLNVFRQGITPGIRLLGITSATDQANLVIKGPLNVSGPVQLPNISYSLALGTGAGSTVDLNGAFFNVLNNGTATGTLFLGPLTDGVDANEFAGGGTVTLNYAASSGLIPGAQLFIDAGTTLNSNNATAMGRFTTLNLSGSGATLNVGASQQVGSFSGVLGTIVNLNPAGNPSQLTILGGTNSTTFAGNIVGTNGSIVISRASLTLSGANSYSGGTTIIRGGVTFASNAAIPIGTRNVTLQSGVVADGAAIDQAFLMHLTTDSAGIVALAANSSNDLDFSASSGANLPNLFLGSSSAFTFSGHLTPFDTTYQFSGGPSSLTVINALTDSSTVTRNLVVGAGALTLVLPATNTYSGTTTIDGGTLAITGSIASNGSDSVFVASQNDFKAASITRRVTRGQSYTGLGSTVISGSAFMLPTLSTRADIRSGIDTNSVANDVAMQWRVRGASDSPRLVSDVLNLTGMSLTTGSHVQTDPFVLQMTYDTTALNGNEAILAAAGLIDLAWLNTGLNQPNGLWMNAMVGSFGSGLPGDVFQNVQSSWDAFAAANGITDANVGNFLGSYGVDTAHHTVWAVVNHNSQFSVVPEPSSLALVIAAGVGVLLAVRRRHRHSVVD